jgi:uncharacterized membrane protein
VTPFFQGAALGSVIGGLGIWVVDGTLWLPSVALFVWWAGCAVVAMALRATRRTPRDTDTQQIDFLRERYITGDIEAEEFERELGRLLRPASDYFPIQRSVVAGADESGQAYCFDSTGDIHPC